MAFPPSTRKATVIRLPARHGSRTRLPRDYENRRRPGTSSSLVLKGVRKYILQWGYAVDTLEYQGFRKVGHDFDSGETAPLWPIILDGAIVLKISE